MPAGERAGEPSDQAGPHQVDDGPVPFGQLLRKLRQAAGLTQEQLAEAAKVSARAISDLERGVYKTARKDTARLLADALKLSGTAREQFEAAADGRPTVSGFAAATRTLPVDALSFTGREAELGQLTLTAGQARPGVYTIGGLAGVGKTALAVHAAHLLAADFPDGQVFLPLYAHTLGHDAVDPADALGSLLKVIGVPAEQIPAEEDARAGLWRTRLAGHRMLIVLDDALDSDQVRSLLPGEPGCLVLITSRQHLTALDDANVISLDALPAALAADLLVSLASRDDLDASDPAVGEIAALCGCLPLALGLLARWLHHHPAWSAADLAGEVRVAQDRLAYMQAENRSVAAAFDLSYADLTPDQQRMFRRLGLHPGTDVDAYLAAAIDHVGLDAAKRILNDLYDHYLLSEPAKGRFRMHDLIKEYAHKAAQDDPPAERVAVTDRLLDYYLHTARAADRHIGHRAPDIVISPPAHVPELDGRQAAIGWMEAERANLHACAQYAKATDRLAHAIEIPATMHEFLRSQGHWHQAISLHELAVDAARYSGGQLAQAKALADLADIRFLTDDYTAAADCAEQALGLCRLVGHRIGEANALTLAGAIHRAAGDLVQAAADLTDALKIYRNLNDRLGEANALTELGTVRQEAGDHGTAEINLGTALTVYRELGNQFGEATARVALGAVQHRVGQEQLATASLTTALGLYRQLGDLPGQARASNGLGEIALARALPRQAREHHEQALAIAEEISAPAEEARALEGLGQCFAADGEPARGGELLRQALAIYQQIGSPRAGDVSFLLDRLRPA